MPPKVSRPRPAQKAELAEKVREIKQRQQTWFKQREKDNTRLSPTEASEDSTDLEGYKSSAPPRAIVRQTHTIRKGNDPSKSPVPNLPDASDVKPGGFKTYLKNKQSPVSESHESVSSDITTASQQQLLSRTSRSSLSPEMFDTLADQIIHKVKREMQVETNNNQGLDDGHRGTEGARNDSGPHSGTSTQKLSSHHCQLCSQLMLAPSHSPKLLIPCGHTFCAVCVERCKMCPECGTPVQTATPNIMLQQVIVEYAEHRPTSQPTRTPSASRNHTPKQKARDLSGEYDTLTVRCEVLESEGEDIVERINKLERRVQERLQDAEGIRHQEELIEQQIEQLRLQQRGLGAERESILDDSESIGDLVREEEGKLNMVTSTIRGLRKDMDKIKRLANGTPR